MTRAGLDEMPSQDVAALRWGLYTRVLVPTATKDWTVDLQEIADAEKPPSSGTLRERRARRREAIQQAVIAQAGLRVTLLLDEPPEPVA